MNTSTRTTACALLIVDMQNCYFQDGELARVRLPIVRACNALVTIARRRGLLVVSVRTEHLRDASTWTLAMLEDGEGFSFRGEPDAQFLDELDIEGSIRLTKTRDSSFVGTPLGDLLHDRHIDTLVVAGVSTHTCVAATAVDAYARNLKVVLARDAIASHRPDLHEQTLATLHDEYRQPSLTNRQIALSLDSADAERIRGH